jgi:1,4-dihydroxy-2-naphthoate octaprenyltransferase
MIGLAYGPWMVLGSVYLHTQALPWQLAIASLVPAGLIMALAVVNAIPDFHQDRLVGKRNLVQRVGRERAVDLYLGLAAIALAVIPVGVVAGIFPATSLLALLALPWIVASVRHARRHAAAPRQFLPAMRYMVIAYLVSTALFTAAILAQRWT